MKKLLLFLLLFIESQSQIVLSGLSEPATIPSGIIGVPGEFIYVKATVTNNYPVQWQTLDPGLKMVPVTMLKSDSTAIFIAQNAGQYRIIVWQEQTRDPPTFAIITVGTVPPPSPPPGPPPPQLLKNMRVAIFYESSQQLPPSQRSILTSTDVLKYIDAHCIKVGNVTEYRLFDKDPSLLNISKAWQDVGKLPRTSLPWVIILDDNLPVFQGPLPLTIAAFLDLLKPYGGP